MSSILLNEIKPDAYDELIVEARVSINPEFALVHKIVESAYREMGAAAIKGYISDDGMPDFNLQIPAEHVEATASFINRPA